MYRMKNLFRRVLLNKDICICLTFILLFVAAFLFTDYGTFRWSLPFLAVGVLLYTIGKVCFGKIVSEKGKKRYWIGIGIAAFLIFAVCEGFLYLVQMDFWWAHIIVDDVINDYDIEHFCQILANIGIIIVDV